MYKYMYVCICMQVEGSKGHQIIWSWSRRWFWDQNSALLQEQEALLTKEPSLQTPKNTQT